MCTVENIMVLFLGTKCERTYSYSGRIASRTYGADPAQDVNK